MPNAVARRRQGYEHEVEMGEHRLVADEPESAGGSDKGPTATQLLAASLASCTSITLLMYAQRKQWELGDLEVAVDYETPAAGAAGAAIEVKISTAARLDDEQRRRLLAIAAKCPVHRTLTAKQVDIHDSLEAPRG
jgi:putative redox protein